MNDIICSLSIRNLYLIVIDLYHGILIIKKVKMPIVDGNYKRHIARIKKIGESAKRRTEIYSGLASLDDRGTARSLGSLQRASAPGKKLQKIGFIFLLSPDPITTPFGIPMIIAGKYLERVYNGATIKDVGQETKNMVGTMSDIKDHM